MDNDFVKIDYKLLNLLLIARYKHRKELIKSNDEELNVLVEDYLNFNGANNLFLNKPAVVERIKRIFFENLLMGENTKITKNGIVEKSDDLLQVFKVLNNGSVMFFRQKDGIKRITLFDEIMDQVVCRFFEYGDNENLKTEKRVILDEYGFDKKYFDLSGEFNEKYREVFQNITTTVKNDSITAFADTGSYTIVPQLDDFFINRKFQETIIDEVFDEDILQRLDIDNNDDDLICYPFEIKIENEENIEKIKNNYLYLKSRYGNIDKWFINRFGKAFLISNSIISADNDIKEKSVLDKIIDASENEVWVNFDEKKIDYENLSLFTKKLYEKQLYYKAYVFLKQMNDEELVRFLNENPSFPSEFLSKIIYFIESDDTKKKILKDEENNLDLENIVGIICSLKDEDDKADLIRDRIDSIIDFDMEKSAYQDEEGVSLDTVSLSTRVLDSFEKKEYFLEFLPQLKYYSGIKYEYIKEFNRDEIENIIDDEDLELNLDEYSAVLRTGAFDDDYIADLLNDNWEDGLNISTDDYEVELNDYVNYSFKVFSLLQMKKEENRLAFLDNHIDDYGADEITTVLKSLGDSEQILSLAKKYELSKYYYLDLLILCDDDKKFEYLNSEKDLEEEDISTLVCSIYDMPKVFDYVENVDSLDIMQKFRILNLVETELYEDKDKIQEVKFEFLKKHKKEIISSIHNAEDYDVFYQYIRDFDYGSSKLKLIESEFDPIFESEEEEK